MRKSTFILLIFYSLTVTATEQVCELLKYKTDVICLENYPLENFLRKNPEIYKNKIMGYAKEICVSSACWRMYKGYWEINNDSLFLTKLINSCGDKVFDLKNIFGAGKVKNGKVFADWVSDTINVGYGELIGWIEPDSIDENDYVNYYNSFRELYSKSFYCELNNGIVKNLEINEKSNCEILSFYANRDFKNSEYTLYINEKFIEENPLPYVLNKEYGIKFKYTDSLDYYFCYDSTMRQNIENKFGSDYMNKANQESQKLINSGRWIRKAEYFGGQVELLKYFSTQIDKERVVFPDNNISLMVQFEISLIGEVINPKVLTDISKELSDSLIKIINEMPYWIPAIYLGKGVKETIIITFDIEDNKLRTLTRGVANVG